MFFVVSTFFCVFRFPREGEIVTVDHLRFFSSSSSSGNVSYVGNIDISYESVGPGLFKYFSLIINFSLPPPNVAFVNMISTSYDPWVIPHPDQVDSFSDVIPLNPTEQAYQAIFFASAVTYETHDNLSMHLDAY